MSNYKEEIEIMDPTVDNTPTQLVIHDGEGNLGRPPLKKPFDNGIHTETKTIHFKDDEIGEEKKVSITEITGNKTASKIYWVMGGINEPSYAGNKYEQLPRFKKLKSLFVGGFMALTYVALIYMIYTPDSNVAFEPWKDPFLVGMISLSIGLMTGVAKFTKNDSSCRILELRIEEQIKDSNSDTAGLYVPAHFNQTRLMQLFGVEKNEEIEDRKTKALEIFAATSAAKKKGQHAKNAKILTDSWEFQDDAELFGSSTKKQTMSTKAEVARIQSNRVIMLSTILLGSSISTLYLLLHYGVIP